MKKIMKTLINKKLFYITSVFFTSAILSGVLVSESNAEGENEPKLSLCDGVWTTKSCEKPEKSLVGVDRPVREKKVEEVVEVQVEEKIEDKSSDSEESSEESETEVENSDAK